TGMQCIKWPAKIIVRNTSKRYRNDMGEQWFYWKIFIKTEPPSLLNQIQAVEYHLHPTFRVKDILITNKNTGFGLEAQGWGEFVIKLDIILNDNRSATISHYLSLDDSADKEKKETVKIVNEKDFS
ncbi:MAG TPA: pYEATS domain-containing protein, partial [Nitrososphaeraceae archaeon]|nr:pYEATS domain-containing protein [Nitrososphaeraceae archaeon]